MAKGKPDDKVRFFENVVAVLNPGTDRKRTIESGHMPESQ